MVSNIFMYIDAKQEELYFINIFVVVSFYSCFCGGGTPTGSPVAAPVAAPVASPVAPPPPSCSDFTARQPCNQEEGCAWRKEAGIQGKACYESLDQATCEQWVDKKKKCKRNGCKYKKNTGACNARWP